MSPEAIPWLLCGAFCILPFLIGSVAFFAWCQVLNHYPTREVSNFVDANGKKHVHTEWIWLTREEKKFHNQPEEKE